MSNSKIDKILGEVIEEALDQGPGFAQEGFVLHEAAKKLGFSSLEQQQKLLGRWHALFRSGKLSGDTTSITPTHPFFTGRWN